MAVHAPTDHDIEQLVARTAHRVIRLLQRRGLLDPDSLRSYLDGVGLDSGPPPIAPARFTPHPELEFAA